MQLFTDFCATIERSKIASMINSIPRQDDGTLPFITKADGTKVTDADTLIQQYIYDCYKISPLVSFAWFTGEEEAAYNDSSIQDYMIVIDPLDGTSSLIKWKQTYGTMVWLCDATGRLLSGMCIDSTGRIFSSATAFPQKLLPLSDKKSLRIDFYNYTKDDSDPSKQLFRSIITQTYNLRDDTYEQTSLPAAIRAGKELYEGTLDAMVRVPWTLEKKTYPDYDCLFLATLQKQWWQIAIGRSDNKNIAIIVAPTIVDLKILQTIVQQSCMGEYKDRPTERYINDLFIM